MYIYISLIHERMNFYADLKMWGKLEWKVSKRQEPNEIILDTEKFP